MLMAIVWAFRGEKWLLVLVVLGLVLVVSGDWVGLDGGGVVVLVLVVVLVVLC